ncbi:MAG: hypothetical protein SF187_30390 [Deltaproteobacteria bacterium]|nr:hypothetical protein [Deltaproteobacteria bacterium]
MQYTTQSLAANDPRWVDRQPGVAEIERMFPSPVAEGKGRKAVEGGVSVVAGPGMGKTSLLAQLAAKLHRDRRLITAQITIPDVGSYADEAGFYAFLGEIVLRTRQSLLQAMQGITPPAAQDASYNEIHAALQLEPSWDVPETQAMTPRGFERFIATLAQAALHTPGICLLFDDVDKVATAPWKGPFISALRFVFQASSGITPIYALWTLFGDESLPGSNYFRNVTRPVFLEPLSADASTPGSRFELVAVGFPELVPSTRLAISRLVGGHPLLLQKFLADLAQRVPDVDARAQLGPEHLAAALGPDAVAEQQQLVATLLSMSARLGTALADLEGKGLPYASLPRGLVASGFVDKDDEGFATLIERAREVLLPGTP